MNEKKNPLLISDIQKEAYLIKLLEKCNMPEEVKVKHINEVKELQKQKI